MKMESLFQRIENNEYKRRTRRTARNRNPTPSIQPLQPISPPNSSTLLPELRFGTGRVYGRGLHAGFDGVGGEEEEVI